MRSAAAAAVATALVLGLAGCSGAGAGGSSSPTPSAAMTSDSGMTAPSTMASSPAAASAATVTIKNFAYEVSGPVKPGQKVTVTNKDDMTHTVTADTGGGFDVTVEGGATASFTAPKAGTYKFHCTYHSNMHGSITVG